MSSARCSFCGMLVTTRKEWRRRNVPKHRGRKPKGSSERYVVWLFEEHVDPETRKRCKGSKREPGDESAVPKEPPF